jgi:hypothetical protein
MTNLEINSASFIIECKKQALKINITEFYKTLAFIPQSRYKKATFEK